MNLFKIFLFLCIFCFSYIKSEIKTDTEVSQQNPPNFLDFNGDSDMETDDELGSIEDVDFHISDTEDSDTEGLEISDSDENDDSDFE